MDTEFKVGDRVTVITDFEHDNIMFFTGDTGIIKRFHSTNRKIIGVEWNKNNSKMHTLQGSCERNKGWFVPQKFLDLESNVSISPHYRVIKKIKSMDMRRKEQGYAF